MADDDDDQADAGDERPVLYDQDADITEAILVEEPMGLIDSESHRGFVYYLKTLFMLGMLLVFMAVVWAAVIVGAVFAIRYAIERLSP